jgi:hypothetical protein
MQAKQHLVLAAGQHVEGPQYRDVAKTLDLPLSAQAIGRAWGSWDNANVQHQRGQSTATLDDYRLRRTAGVRRTHEDYRTALRDWLTTGPPAPPSQRDYERWREGANRRLDGGQKPYPNVAAIQARFNAGWEQLIAWAPTDGPAPVQDRGLDDDPGPLGLVSRHGAARVILGGAFVGTAPDSYSKLGRMIDSSTVPQARRFDEFRKRLDPIRASVPEGLADPFTMDAVADLIRVTRNDAGRPSGRLIDEDTTHTHLCSRASCSWRW